MEASGPGGSARCRYGSFASSQADRAEGRVSFWTCNVMRVIAELPLHSFFLWQSLGTHRPDMVLPGSFQYRASNEPSQNSAVAYAEDHDRQNQVLQTARSAVGSHPGQGLTIGLVWLPVHGSTLLPVGHIR